MIFCFIVGFIVWTLCILLMLAIFHGGHRIRGHGYEQKLCLKGTVNTQNYALRDQRFNKKRSEEDYKKGNLLKKVFETIRNQSCNKRNGCHSGLITCEHK